jgi:predicted DNA-binding mobile mystery protein A
MEKAERNAIARRHLDAKINAQTPIGKLTPPSRGWLKAVREALGMTTAQLARRMGISQPGIVMLEQSEAAATIKLETLARAAEALNCRLVYALIPNEPLETMVQARARLIAKQHIGTVEHTMRLENQGVEDAVARERQVESVSRKIDARILWNGL